MPKTIAALRTTGLLRWATPVVVFAVLLAILALVNRSSGPASSSAGGVDSGPSRQPTSLDTEGAPA